jgi:hypothetical protein
MRLLILSVVVLLIGCSSGDPITGPQGTITQRVADGQWRTFTTTNTQTGVITATESQVCVGDSCMHYGLVGGVSTLTFIDHYDAVGHLIRRQAYYSGAAYVTYTWTY